MTKNTKRCPDCKKILSVKEFVKDKYTKSGLKGYCKKCANKKRVNWQRNNPEKFVVSARKAYLKSQYNLTLAQYDKMLDGQNGVCAICGGINDRGYRLAVDHNHETGKIRGLLCSKCNLGLPILEDKDWRFLAEKYLYDNRG